MYPGISARLFVFPRTCCPKPSFTALSVAQVSNTYTKSSGLGFQPPRLSLTCSLRRRSSNSLISPCLTFPTQIIFHLVLATDTPGVSLSWPQTRRITSLDASPRSLWVWPLSGSDHAAVASGASCSVWQLSGPAWVVGEQPYGAGATADWWHVRRPAN